MLYDNFLKNIKDNSGCSHVRRPDGRKPSDGGKFLTKFNRTKKSFIFFVVNCSSKKQLNKI